MPPPARARLLARSATATWLIGCISSATLSGDRSARPRRRLNRGLEAHGHRRAGSGEWPAGISAPDGHTTASHGPGSVPPACVILSFGSHAFPSLPLVSTARMARQSALRPVPAASARRWRPNRTSPRPRPRPELALALALPRGAEWPREVGRVGHDTAGVMGRPGLQLVARWCGYRSAKSRVSEVSGSERGSPAAALLLPSGQVSGR